MDYTKLIEGIEEMKRIALQQQESLKESAVREAVAGGAAVLARPEYFPMPIRAKKGEPANLDPWFSYTQWEWQAEMDAGFDGWIAVNEGSGRNKRKIHFESARRWFEKKLSGQQERRKAQIRVSAPAERGEVAA